MSIEATRKSFEDFYPLPPRVKWNELTDRYVVYGFMSDWLGIQSDNLRPYNIMWEVWRVGHAHAATELAGIFYDGTYRNTRAVKICEAYEQEQRL